VDHWCHHGGFSSVSNPSIAPFEVAGLQGFSRDFCRPRVVPESGEIDAHPLSHAIEE
jgi:hypothetical protein